MAAFMSLFSSNQKCFNCQRTFKITSTRRQCVVCSKFYLERLFCRFCSVKITHANLAIFSTKRYCRECYNLKKHKARKTELIQYSNSIISLNQENILSSDIEQLQKILEIDRESIQINRDSIFALINHGIQDLPSIEQFENLVQEQIRTIPEHPENHFKFKKKIGYGSSGTVYLVYQTSSNQYFAIKQIQFFSQDQKQKILQQTALNKLTQSQSIVQIFQIYQAENSIWVLSELMNGNLTQLIISKRLPEHFIAYIFFKILCGLKALHDQHRIHRHLKSQNILLSIEGQIKISGFDSAIQLTLEEQNRKTKIGTPSWMAPQLIKGQNYNTSVDIWSLGIIGIQLAQGQPPFLHQSPMKALFHIASGPPPQLVNPQKYSLEFKDFLSKCLQKEPQNRQSAGQLFLHPFFNIVTPESQFNFSSYLQEWVSSKRKINQYHLIFDYIRKSLRMVF